MTDCERRLRAWNASRAPRIPARIVTFAASWLLVWSQVSLGQELPAPRFPAGAPETQEVVVEQIYRYRVRQFTPPVRIKPVAKGAASYATPEDALIAQCSAMLAGDYEWWRSGWDKTGQERVAKRGPEYWTTNWRDLLGNRTFVVLQRAETAGAVIYAYKLDPPPQIEALAQGTIVFHQDSGRWAVTNALEEDPVHLWWLTPERRGRMVARKE